MFDACFTDTEVSDYRGYFRGNQEISRRFNAALLKRGILKSDGKYYVSLAHDEKDVAQTIAAWEGAARELRDAKVV